MYCPQCKLKFNDNLSFCTNCGRPLVADPVQPNNSNQTMNNQDTVSNVLYQNPPINNSAIPPQYQNVPQNNGAIPPQRQNAPQNNGAIPPQYQNAPQNNGAIPPHRQNIQPNRGPVPPQYQNVRVAPNQGNIPPTASMRNNAPSAPYAAPNYNIQNIPPKKKRKKALKLCLIALFLTVAIVGVYILNIYNGPLLTVARAAKNTFEAGSFSAEIEYSTELLGTEGTYKGKAEASWNVEKRTVSFYAEFESSTNVANIYESDDKENYTMALNNGIWATCKTTETYTEYQYKDVSKEVDRIFDAYESTRGKSFSEFFTKEFIITLLGEEKAEEFCEKIDLDELKKSVSNYAQNLNDESWLDENANFDEEKSDGVTYYYFMPNVKSFAKTTASEFKSSFKNSDDYLEFEKNLVKDGEKIDDSLEDLAIRLLIKDDMLYTVSFNSKYSGATIKGEIRLSNIGASNKSSSKADELIEKANGEKSSENSDETTSDDSPLDVTAEDESSTRTEQSVTYEEFPSY